MYDYGNDSDDEEFNYDLSGNHMAGKAEKIEEPTKVIYQAPPIAMNIDQDIYNKKQKNDNDLEVEDDWDFNVNENQPLVGKNNS